MRSSGLVDKMTNPVTLEVDGVQLSVGPLADSPLMSSVIPRALIWKRRQHPSSRASTLLTGCFRASNTHNKWTGVCRFVRGIPVGIGRRVADLWGRAVAGSAALCVEVLPDEDVAADRGVR
jgi:hypothetical protein